MSVGLWQNERCLWDVFDPEYADKDTTKASKRRIADADKVIFGECNCYCMRSNDRNHILATVVLLFFDICNVKFNSGHTVLSLKTLRMNESICYPHLPKYDITFWWTLR